ncbi:hypothetical protein [Sphingorhabdus sp. SMR4y]|uniref:hypothetical protein n=1 Tax=Sphingorhabdus sp. SMR4y TaxID=2584094 RepID=UPI000B5C687A|nr:hypothetical protein [Sphingorhabdus sp. SMR4y]ASK89336.1 hypothetical protein SPHFLASMR4Y_02598 [Sphingorhabdus sp. SMR4y]
MFDPNDECALLSRRTMLAGGISLGIAGSMAGSTSAAAAFAEPPVPNQLLRERGIPTDTASRVALMRRMRLRTDAGPVFWYFRGRNYAQQGANLIPICELVFGAVMLVTPNRDGTLDVVQYELGFRSPLGSAKRTDQLLNPITGEMIDLPFAPVGPTHIKYDTNNTLELPENIGGSSFSLEHVPEVFYRVGDTVSFQTHSRAIVKTPGQNDRVLNDMSMISSPDKEALDPDVACASAVAYGGDVTDYARWLKMPPGAGTQTLRSVGEKVTRYSDMPEDWRMMLAESDPVMAADPIAGLSREAAVYRN